MRTNRRDLELRWDGVPSLADALRLPWSPT
jgi:hypothetical protein